MGTPSPKGEVKAGLPLAPRSTPFRSPDRGSAARHEEAGGCAAGFVVAVEVLMDQLLNNNNNRRIFLVE